MPVGNTDSPRHGLHPTKTGVIKADYEEIVTHFAGFARRIARESNIQLPTDDPSPTVENLGGHFWYDDGIHPWHDAIHEA